MKHKHVELIHAWADGAEIQYKSRGNWIDAINPIFWHNDNEYRIKPEEKQPVVRWAYAYKDNGYWKIGESFLTDEAFKKFPNSFDYIKLEYTRMEFDE